MSLFRMLATLLQHCYAVLPSKSSLRIVPCNITLKREIRHFHVVVLQWRQRNIQKKCDARAKLLFWLLNLLLFWRPSFRRRRRILRSLLSMATVMSCENPILIFHKCFGYSLNFIRLLRVAERKKRLEAIGWNSDYSASQNSLIQV